MYICCLDEKEFFLFDSHSKNEKGECCPDGFSTILKFSCKSALESHIAKNYLTEDDGNTPFEIQYITVTNMNDQYNLSNDYYTFKEKERKAGDKEKKRKAGDKEKKRKASENEKSKCRERNSNETQKNKCKKCKATCTEKEKTRKRVANHYAKEKFASDSNRISAFKAAVGPYYICVVCNRCLYKRTVKLFNESKYELEINLFTPVLSFDSIYYICCTCDRHLSEKEIPCQAVWNKLSLDDLPEEIAVLNRLEKVLFSKRILFKKISIMPKGQQPKIKGAICNIPVRADAVSNCLPRSADNNGLLFVKLKRKIMFRGHVYFESVRPEFIQNALTFLKNCNPFYSNILIQMDNISKELLSLSDVNAIVNHDIFPVAVENDNENLEGDNPLDNERVNSGEMCVVPNIYNEGQNLLDIAPGENKTPESFFNDDFCEEQAFPYLFPKGRFGYKIARAVKLSPVKYFNQRLLNYTQRFPSNADYIFFCPLSNAAN